MDAASITVDGPVHSPPKIGIRNYKPVICEPPPTEGIVSDMSTTITVPTLSDILNSSVPAIAVSFADRVPESDLERARREGLDVFELRIDRYTSSDREHVLAEVRRFENFPTIATIRTADEGGQWAGSDEERLGLFRAVVPYVNGIDIELASASILLDVVPLAKSLRKVVIISNHNFEATPPMEDLEEMARHAKERGADFVKLSAMANSFEDLRTLATFTMRNADLGLIVIAMGQHGTASRVFFPALGSRLTYAYSRAWPVSGQLTYEETFEHLRLYYPEFNEKKIVELEILENV